MKMEDGMKALLCGEWSINKMILLEITYLLVPQMLEKLDLILDLLIHIAMIMQILKLISLLKMFLMSIMLGMMIKAHN